MKTRLILVIGILLAFGTFADSVKYVKKNAQKKTPQRQQTTARSTASSSAPKEQTQGRRGLQTVTVTGRGESLEQAREDAKRNALEQVLGETIKGRSDMTENGDKAGALPQFISADGGFIAKFDETGTSNEDGMYAVTANVTVNGEKLLEAVTFGNDSAEIDKEM